MYEDQALLVTPEDIERLFPRPLDEHERTMLVGHLEQAEKVISIAFARQGRDFAEELERVPWLPDAAEIVIRSMVNAVVLVGANRGVRSVSSTTGPTNDAITFADVKAVDWGGVRLSDQQKRDLGLSAGHGPVGSFPPPMPWPEVIYPWNQ